MRHLLIFFIAVAGMILAGQKALGQTFYANRMDDFPAKNFTYRITLSNCQSTAIPAGDPTNNASQLPEKQYTDVAIDQQGNYYMVSGWGSLYRQSINDVSTFTFLGTFNAVINCLVTDMDGTVIAAGNNNGGCVLYRYDPATGNFSVIGSMPPNYFAAGDLFFYEGRLFMTGTTSTYQGGYLVEINLADPPKSCLFMDLGTLQGYSGFSINTPSGSKAYLVSVVATAPSQYQSSLREINLAAKSLGPVLCTFPYSMSGAATAYTYTPLPTNPTPTIAITSSANQVCEGTDIRFEATITDGGNSPVYQWRKNGNPVGTNSPTYNDKTLAQNDVVDCVLTPGYTCVATSQATSNRITMNIIRLLVPSVTIAPDRQSVCAGDGVLFTAQAAQGGNAPVYQWFRNGVPIAGNNKTTYLDTPVVKQNYIYCLLTSSEQCVTARSVRSNIDSVPVRPLPVVPFKDSMALCENTTLMIDAGNFASFVWNDGSTNRYLPVNNLGRYSVQVTDRYGCQSKYTTYVTRVAKLPSGFMPGDTTICSYQSLLLKPLQPFISYRWNTGSTTPTLLAAQAGTYWLEATTRDGCTARESIVLSHKKCLEGFFMPTAFTPNRDGRNEWLRPVLLGRVANYRFQVYNRWGSIVFQTTSFTQGWDGAVNGQSQASGVYVWTCQYQLEGEATVTRKGTVVLVR